VSRDLAVWRDETCARHVLCASHVLVMHIRRHKTVLVMVQSQVLLQRHAVLLQRHLRQVLLQRHLAMMLYLPRKKRLRTRSVHEAHSKYRSEAHSNYRSAQQVPLGACAAVYLGTVRCYTHQPVSIHELPARDSAGTITIAALSTHTSRLWADILNNSPVEICRCYSETDCQKKRELHEMHKNRVKDENEFAYVHMHNDPCATPHVTHVRRVMARSALWKCMSVLLLNGFPK